MAENPRQRRPIGKRLYDMLNTDALTDVTFIVQGTEIKGHRVVASSHDGILRQLVENSTTNRIEIDEDVAPHTFNTVLQYLYTDTCEVNDSNLFEVTHAAKYFGLVDLENLCAETVRDKLTERNVGAYAAQALHWNSKENVRVCQEYFRSNTSRIIKTKQFLEMPQPVLLALCQCEGITFSELELFLACVTWARKRCQRRRLEATPANLREALGDVLNEIHFPCIPKEDFEEHVTPLEILTYEEIGRISVGWCKKENRSHYPGHSRTEIVQVRIQDYRKAFDYADSVVDVPLTSTIQDIKKMKIFKGGREKYPPESFMLAADDRELSDDVGLASIRQPGKELVLRVHSVKILAAELTGHWEHSVIIRTDYLWDRGHNIILGHLLSYENIQPGQVKAIYRKTKGNKYRFPAVEVVHPGFVTK